MSNTYFDDQQEIGPLELKLLRELLADMLRDRYRRSSAADELALAKELVALFEAGFRTREELKAMTAESIVRLCPEKF
ncbi:hypothetical protein ACQKP1_23985 [Allorhizobium sp. NPDC080224]|uniref:hypothetical protein n=1 Tax=Allorhizobium sp. NPDC080224 TaxID=3390547 RepID=UPI003D00F87A